MTQRLHVSFTLVSSYFLLRVLPLVRERESRFAASAECRTERVRSILNTSRPGGERRTRALSHCLQAALSPLHARAHTHSQFCVSLHFAVVKSALISLLCSPFLRGSRSEEPEEQEHPEPVP